MLFTSLDFVVFLAVTFSLYWRLPLRGQNLLLLAASYVFYGWWDWRFLGLIILSSAVDFVAGARIAGSSSVSARRRWLALSLGVNLGTLGLFKYFDFFAESLAAALGVWGIPLNAVTLNLVLPVGISFYTFQTLSYTIDIYRNNAKPHGDVVEFFTFVAFFPQLVAGPIERAHNLLDQFHNERHFDWDNASNGLRQMLWGLFKKAVIADTLAPYVEEAYTSPDASGATLLLATVYFAFQIYCDFSGYSDIAIGCARLFGIRLMRNFAYPYFSKDLSEFWRRWHISLSTWFRDYVYIPLGGNRFGELARMRNLFITFLVSGLWHGASWTFVAWGAIHGLAVMPASFSKGSSSETSMPGGEGIFPPVVDAARVAVTFAITCFAWILFRARDMPHAWSIMRRIAVDTDPSTLLLSQKLPKLLVLFLLIVEWFGRRLEHPLECLPRATFARWAIYYGLAVIILLYGHFSDEPFIYFQF